MTFSIGETVGAYRIREELGRGGMGRVFKVEHTITRRLEAMKVLEGGRPDAPEQAARSLREIQLQASLSHPNIAAVHNAFWADENLILVMELIEGRSLRSVLETQRLSIAAATDYACQALSALGYAHEHGVIHRDVSPANMMITPPGVLKLMDFGLAKGPADVRLSVSGAALGSLYYMSPEQVRGSEADRRSDIYSMGAVLYELVTGRRPFEGEAAFAIMAKQVDEMPVPPIEVDPKVPPALNSAILRALEKDPARRFPSADHFLSAVAEVPHLQSAHKPVLIPALARSRGALIAASAVAAAAATVGIFRIAQGYWPGAQTAAPAVIQPRLVLRDNPAPEPAKSETTADVLAQEPTTGLSSVIDRGNDDRPVPPVSDAQPSAATSPAEENAEAPPKRVRGPLVKVLGKIWRLGRHPKPSSQDDTEQSGRTGP
jgi:eukaryotic-like serine/threonine-protein kinase